MADTKIPRKDLTRPRTRQQEKIDQIDEAAADSFPASDPPSFTPVTAVGPPAHAETDEAGTSPSVKQTPGPAGGDQPLAAQDVLPDLLHQLEIALISLTPLPEQEWQVHVVDELRAARAGLWSEDRENKPADNSAVTIDQERPTLVRQEDQLRQDQADLQSQIRMLLIMFEKEAEDRTLDFSHIQRRVELVLEGLRQHRTQETGLILESLCTDIGTGD